MRSAHRRSSLASFWPQHLVVTVAARQRQGRDDAGMVGRPQAEAGTISRGGAHDLHILYRERPAKLHKIDAMAHGGGHVEEVFVLADR